MEEVWKDIEGFEGLYEISSLGRIRTIPHNVDHGKRTRVVSKRILKIGVKSNGYQHIKIYKDTKQYTYYIHRLVAMAFLSNPNGWSDVNHKNGIKSDNRVENLEWCSRSANQLHSSRVLKNKIGCYGKGHLSPHSIPIIQYTLNNEYIKEWASATEVQRELGIKESNIRKCLYTLYHNPLTKRQYTAGGFKWRYKEV
jgi:hypothetical protein